MPSQPKEHWEFTIREWTNDPFVQITSALPERLNVIYDIGANVGGFSKIMKDKYPDSEVYCFEPITLNYSALREFMPTITSFKLGIFYGQRQSRALWRGSNIGAFFVEHIDAGKDVIDAGEIMELRTLEELELPKPDMIKMDVEGAEENIIEHSQVVKECPCIIVEWHPSTNPFQFFEKHLPNHEIKINLENKQFLLCLK